jgi:LPXTG-motif cell wall-anchored protein
MAAALAAAAAALGAGATAGSAPTGGAAAGVDRAPVASLRVRHHRVRVGTKVLLDSSRSRDPDGRIVDHLWDLDGDGVYERDSGRRARIRHAFKRPGKVRVGVMVIDRNGAYSTRRLRLRALPTASEDHRAVRRSTRARRHRRHARLRAATRTATTVKPRPQARARSSSTTAAPAKTLHLASVSTGDVTISDYKFTPPSITVKVGDTVVWRNDGPLAHSATADDGSFDTGLLSKGATGSFKFTKAGKFSYHCTPHPFMTASVTVTGSGGGSTSNSTSSNSGGNGSTSSSKSSSLPHTGLQIASVVLAGLALLGAGTALRRRLRRA